MSVKIAKSHEMGTKEMRATYCETLIDMAKEDDRIVIVEADLMNAGGTKPFRAEFPDRTFDCGVQEANMVGVSAGLSSRGFIPFCHSFGTFASRRVADQVFMSCAYAKQNVKIVGSDPGITAALNGGTHMPFEDIGIMTTIPEMTVVEPCDNVSLEKVIRLAKDTYGTWYIRMHRKVAPVIYEADSEFTVGKSCLIKEGYDVTIIALGDLVPEAIKAADALEKEGISARVIDMWCVKPLDDEAVIAAAKETGAIVTAENHNIKNGMGSQVASCLALNCPAPIEMVGAQDEFGEVGQVDYLKERFHMTADDIVEKAKKVLARKS